MQSTTWVCIRLLKSHLSLFRQMQTLLHLNVCVKYSAMGEMTDMVSRIYIISDALKYIVRFHHSLRLVRSRYKIWLSVILLLLFALIKVLCFIYIVDWLYIQGQLLWFKIHPPVRISDISGVLWKNQDFCIRNITKLVPAMVQSVFQIL